MLKLKSCYTRLTFKCTDIVETINKELDAMAAASDRLEMIEKHFND